MSVNEKPLKLRLVSGNYFAVESALNLLLDDYTAVTWNFCPIGDEVRITVVLVHNTVMRQQQIAQAAMAPPNRR